ncbi:hypothetical protein FB45DRAFT_804041 [Roridomyces roridus]|uniref:AB hydrolase-1 domain-containing protein n=1 Tax=Roridomyces roridus TaxID=1738132 RepID=A0AAD7B5F8_9AGAR|nr:hypothetical protein FB45DRAFT_804041 [Roridomyces roridus]
MLFSALVLLSYLSDLHIVSGSSCACSHVTIPVHVDALVPTDPTDAFAGLQINASSVFQVNTDAFVPTDPTEVSPDLRRVNETYDIAGTFCRPDVPSPQNADVIQLLVHGFTYSSEYWSPSVAEFRNYSYAAFSCERGFASLAIDQLGVGLSSRPSDPSDVQFPTSAAAISEVARHLKSASILPGVPPFKKIIGIGHSVGSALLTFNSIVEGTRSVFDGLILTALLSVQPGTSFNIPLVGITAQEANPDRWGSLHPGYFTTENRSLFYPPNAHSYSPRMIIHDNFTKDLGSISIAMQLPTTSLEAEYTGAVAKVIGSEDRSFCVGTGRCDDVVALRAAEGALWPAAKSFDLVVAQGSGHDMNLDFFAREAFATLVEFVERFSRL